MTSLNEDDDHPCSSTASSFARCMLHTFTMMVIFPLEVAGASVPSMYTWVDQTSTSRELTTKRRSLSNWGNEGVVCIVTDVSTLKWEPEEWS